MAITTLYPVDTNELTQNAEQILETMRDFVSEISRCPYCGNPTQETYTGAVEIEEGLYAGDYACRNCHAEESAKFFTEGACKGMKQSDASDLTPNGIAILSAAVKNS